MKRITKRRCLLWLPLLLLVAGSCTQADVEEGNIPPHALKDVEASFNLHVLASSTPVTRSITFTPEGSIDSDSLTVGVKDSLQTKAATEVADESAVSELWVGQYHAGTGSLISSQYIGSVTANKVTLKLKQNENGGSSNIWFVANLGDLDNNGKITTETGLKQLVLDYSSTADGLPTNGLCGMTGMWSGAVNGTNAKNIKVNLTRLIAKISFTYQVGAGFSFTPKSVTLKSVPTKYQIEAPTAQLGSALEIGYMDYTGTASTGSARMYWYLPENLAGTVTASGVAVSSEKEKTGNGVTNATYIELTGDAVQDGVTFQDVTFKFYPGKDCNDYNIRRNSHYTIEVTLVGIDASDKRITVGTLPSVILTTDKMTPAIDSEKEVTIVAQPGVDWSFTMPSWLSAMIENQTVSPNTDATHQGPYQLTFKATSSNPNSSDRNAAINVNIGGKDCPITITQAGSSFEASISPTTALAATAGGTTGTFTMNGTKGLNYSFTSGFPDWLTVNDPNGLLNGKETSGSEQQLTYVTNSVNLNSTERAANISVKAGDITQTIEIKQSGSEFKVDKTEIELESTASSGFIDVTGTNGLRWTVSPAVETKGIKPDITEKTADGSVQTVTFHADENTGGAREVTFTIAVPKSDHSQMVKVKQKAAPFTGEITIDQSVLQSYYGQLCTNPAHSWETFPPFDDEGTDAASKHSSITNVDLTVIPPVLSGSYSIQVEKGQSESCAYKEAQRYCSELEEDTSRGWRLPTIIELHAIYKKREVIESVSSMFHGTWYWSSSIPIKNSELRSVIMMSSGIFSGNAVSGNSHYVRCVRDL